MKRQTIRDAGYLLVVLLWAALALTAWFSPAKETSDAERRKLAQFPSVNLETIQTGSFMSDFEDYALDQFPVRDRFRQLKAWFQYDVLRQKDNNGILYSNGYAAKLEYPLNEKSVNHALSRFQNIYEQYLKDSGSEVYTAVVPDKNYYLSQIDQGLAMDYDRLFSMIQAGMPYASYVDLTAYLSLEDYYRTDTHWRQEKLLPAAKAICAAMQVPAPKENTFTTTIATDHFYGVYYGQAALPMEPEKLYYLESDLLRGCQVYHYETDRTTGVYDLEKLNGKDPYDVFLSGAESLMTIENPQAVSDRELIVFRDSFGSSMIPLLLQGYRRVTVVDIRYIASSLMENYVNFHGQDVLFLYSTLVLNSSDTLK